MINWAQVTGFDWDEGNSRKNAEKHGANQSEAEEIFFNEPLLLLEDSKHSQAQTRFHALGETDDERLLHITFTLRQSGTLVRVISARDMHRKERLFMSKLKRCLSLKLKQKSESSGRPTTPPIIWTGVRQNRLLSQS